MLSGPALWTNVRPAVSFTEKEVPEGRQSQPTMITSEAWAVVSDTEHVVTYPHPFLALPSSDGGLTEVVELVVELDVELLEVVVDGAGCSASVITPKSLLRWDPNASVAEDSALEVTSYCAYASCPPVLDWIRVNPVPAVSVPEPVSPPSWKTKSALFVETPVLHGSPLGQAMFAWARGKEGFVSKGLAVFAPETPKATTPYHVSPVKAVWTETTSPVSADGAIAYHSWRNSFPPMPICPVLCTNVRPAVSFTEKEEPAGHQLHPTMITSEAWVVVSDTEHAVT